MYQHEYKRRHSVIASAGEETDSDDELSLDCGTDTAT